MPTIATIAAFFSSLHKTLVAGLVLLIVIIIIVGAGERPVHQARRSRAGGGSSGAGATSWPGIMWMGLLWYLNFVQTPTVPKIEPAEHRAAITKYIAPNVLFWFRYSALVTVDLRADPRAA